MALIKCSECQREISDKAKSCPNCGNPIIAGDCVPRKFYEVENWEPGNVTYFPNAPKTIKNVKSGPLKSAKLGGIARTPNLKRYDFSKTFWGVVACLIVGSCVAIMVGGDLAHQKKLDDATPILGGVSSSQVQDDVYRIVQQRERGISKSDIRIEKVAPRGENVPGAYVEGQIIKVGWGVADFRMILEYKLENGRYVLVKHS